MQAFSEEFVPGGSVECPVDAVYKKKEGVRTYRVRFQLPKRQVGVSGAQ